MVEYLVSLIIWTAIYALFSLGLNLQWGFTGLINFGHIAFMTIGAYGTTLLSLQGIPQLGISPFPLWLALLCGALGACLLGFFIGTSTLRLREDYLAIVTIGISELLRSIVNNEKIVFKEDKQEWIQGALGVLGYSLPLEDFQPNLLGKYMMILLLTILAIFTLWRLWLNLKKQWQQQRQIKNKSFQPRKPISVIVWGTIAFVLLLIVYINGVIGLYNYTYKAGLMLLILITLGVIYFALESLVHSPWGRILKAIREDEEIPKALGKNVFWYKLQAFMLGGVIAGIAGGFYAWQLTSIYPSPSFEPLITFYAWIIVVLGGSGNNAGTLLGAVIFWAYDSLTRFLLTNSSFIDNAQLSALRVMIIGLILMLLMIWRPQGILGKKEELSLGR
jgi:neutral amino acid transport system permease protein